MGRSMMSGGPMYKTQAILCLAGNGELPTLVNQMLKINGLTLLLPLGGPSQRRLST